MHYEFLLRVATKWILVGVHFPPSVFVERANTTQLPFLKSHFLPQCEEGVLFFFQSIWNFHYRVIGVRPTEQTIHVAIHLLEPIQIINVLSFLALVLQIYWLALMFVKSAMALINSKKPAVALTVTLIFY